MNQTELEKLKTTAENLGRWAEYYLTEMEYWTPTDLQEMTEEKLQNVQENNLEWLRKYREYYPDGGAEEALRAEITEELKNLPQALTEDEAYELEMQRMEGLEIQDLPKALKEIRQRSR